MIIQAFNAKNLQYQYYFRRVRETVNGEYSCYGYCFEVPRCNVILR